MSVYRPLRTVQRNLGWGPIQALGAYAAGRALNYGRSSFRRIRNSVYGRAVPAVIAATLAERARRVRAENNNNNSRNMPATPRGRTRTRSAPATPSRTRANSVRSSTRSRMSTRTRRSATNSVSTGSSVALNGGKNSLGKVYKGKTKKVRKQKLDKGITYSVEQYGGVTSNFCVYFGHSSHNLTPTFRVIFLSLVKKLAMKIGMPVRDFSEGQNFTAIGDLWSMTYAISQEAGPVAAINYTTVGAAYNLDTVANNLLISALNLFNANPNNQLQFLSFEYTPSSALAGAYTYQRLDLKSMVCEVKCTSRLKFQNRTKSAGADENVDVVDSRPLEGRQYIGTGNGTDHVSAQRTVGATLVTDRDTALLSFGWNLVGDPNWLKSPPPTKDLLDVKQSSKIGIAPGEIQTHQLKHTVKMYFNSFIAKLVGGATAMPARMKTSLGKFGFISLERMIFDTQADQSIDIVYQLDQFFQADCYGSPKTKTATIVQETG